MPASLEARRTAVADALRVVAREAATSPAPTAGPALDVHAVQARLDTLSRQISEVLTRLGSVETAVLESVWERQAPDPAPATETPYGDRPEEACLDEEEPDADERVSVPAVPFGEVRMSSVASRALFGG